MDKTPAKTWHVKAWIPRESGKVKPSLGVLVDLDEGREEVVRLRRLGIKAELVECRWAEARVTCEHRIGE